MRVKPKEVLNGYRAAPQASTGPTTWHTEIPFHPLGLSGRRGTLSRDRTGELAPLESIRPRQSFCHPQVRAEELARAPKNPRGKQVPAWWLQQRTTVGRHWMSQRSWMGEESGVTRAVGWVKANPDAD